MNEQEQYSAVCKDRFDNIETKCDAITDEIIGLKHQMFQDNGNKSWQTRINENSLWSSVVKWTTITFSSSIVIGGVGLVFWLLKTKL